MENENIPRGIQHARETYILSRNALQVTAQMLSTVQGPPKFLDGPNISSCNGTRL